MILGFGNNVKGALASDISALQTTIPVMPGTGALFAQTLTVESALENSSFPTTPGQIYAKLTICDEQETVFEIVHLLSVSGDTLTVIRGQENTSARSWHLADVISNFATRGSEVKFVQVEELQKGKYQAFAAGGTANALTVDMPSTFFINTQNTFSLRAPVVLFPQFDNTSAVTIQLSVSGQLIGTFPVLKGGNLPLEVGDISEGMPFIVVFSSDKACFRMTGSGSSDIAINEWHHYFAPEWESEFSPYIRGTVVRYNNAYWVSLVNNNTAIPGTDPLKWQSFIFERADNDDADAGTDPNLIITPPVLKHALSTLDYGLLPIGSAILWFTPVCPDGFLEANGQAFDQTANPKLKAVFPSGRVPDFRDRYIYTGDGTLPFGSKHDEGSLAHYHHTGVGIPSQDDIYPIYRGNRGYQNLPTFGVHGEGNRLYQGSFPENYSWPNRVLTGTTDPLKTDNTPGMPAINPRRLVAMIIIKTDGAEAIPPTPTPTAVTVSPALIQGGVGDTGHITAAVVPSSLSSQYPITFTSSDTSIITVDSNGNWQIVGGGDAYITASISTGMGAVVTVNAYIMLTGLTMDPIPDMAENGSYTLQITSTPANATEPMIYTSSNPNIATVSNGVIYGAGNGSGTATITATGQYSGVSASQSVNITAIPTEESRTLRVPSGETVSEFPVAADRAGKFVAFDANGDATIADIPAGGLHVPVEIPLESGLPADLSSYDVGYYWVIQEMDVTAPGHTGRAWVNNDGPGDAKQIHVVWDQFFETGRLLRIIKMESSGTYTPSPDARAILVELVGAGGGQDEIASNGSYGGRGAGGYVKAFITSLASSYSVTVGATNSTNLDAGNTSFIGGGVTLIGLGSPRVDGSNSSAATNYVMQGGNGGATVVSGNVDWSLRIDGEPGGSTWDTRSTLYRINLGHGGSSPLGTGGYTASYSTVTPTIIAPTGYGSSCCGGYCTGSTVTTPAQTGRPGVVIIHEYS